MNQHARELNPILKWIGLYQIFGGLVGLIVSVWQLPNIEASAAMLSFLLIPIFALYSFSIICGILILKRNRAGLPYTLLNHYLQLVSFSIAGFALRYVSGAVLSIGVDLTDSFLMKFHVALSTWKVNINAEPEKVEVSLNLVALSIILLIDNIKNKLASNQTGELEP